jgi:cell division protein FtsB
MSAGDWIGIGALVVSLVAMILAYIRQPSFVTSGRIENLRRTIEDLTTENGRLTGRIAFLEARVEALMSENRWWQEEYRKARSGGAP